MSFLDTYKDDLIRFLLWLTLLAALLSSMRHMAWLFSTVELGPGYFNWIAALSFDMSIFLLTLIAHRYTEGTKPRRFIQFGIYANAAISIAANMLYYVEHQKALERVGNLYLAAIPILVGLATPITVVYLSEILSREEAQSAESYQRKQAALARKEARKQAKLARTQAQNTPEDMPENRQIPRCDKIEQVYNTLADGPARNRQIVALTGFGRSSVTEYLAELQNAGRIIRRGQLYHLAESGALSGGNLANELAHNLPDHLPSIPPKMETA